MVEGKTVFSINYLDNGEVVVTDANGNPARKLDSQSLGETLTGREIKNAKTVSMTVLESNPCWVYIYGNWYWIP